jgi:hypothetical protein
MASGHVSRIKRPDTWLHRPMLQNVKKALANPEPSTQDPKRPSRACLRRWPTLRDRAAADQTDRYPRLACCEASFGLSCFPN